MTELWNMQLEQQPLGQTSLPPAPRVASRGHLSLGNLGQAGPVHPCAAQLCSLSWATNPQDSRGRGGYLVIDECTVIVSAGHPWTLKP